MDETRQPNYRADQSTRQRDEMGHQGGLPEEAVGQGQNPPAGQGQPDREPRQPGMDIGSRDEERGSLSRDEEGERDTEIRREVDFQNATATPLNDEAANRPKVTREDDLFGKEGEA